ncbi:MAG: NADH-quinone oxidoreductase subunit NuoE [bacterium]
MADNGLERIVEKYRGSPGALIPVLQEAQEALGYLSPETLKGIARGLKTPLSRVYGVATFYAQFHLKPKGKHSIKVCQGTACHVKGAGRILQTLENHLKVKAGNPTKDMRFQLETVACLGTCFLAPVVMIDTDYYGTQTPKTARKITRKYGAEES